MTKTNGSAEQKSRGAIVADPELVAINRIAKTLDGLKPDVRERVLTWLSSRYATSACGESGDASD